MRGTLLSYRKRANFLGIIPAYAGNTRAPVSPWAPDGDHPRICGEHYNFMDCAFLGWGSSPHMRGTHAFNLANGLIGGIIPAYAGNTSRIIRSALGIWDHPRICGEHGGLVFGEIIELGSSPHMRGTPDSRFSGSIPHGIIPAYAGNTIMNALVGKMARDHPRICGEHQHVRHLQKVGEGSSPHMRGTLHTFGVLQCFFGIIPAYAGNTH